MISDLKLAPVPHHRCLVVALLPPHHALVQGPIAWRAVLAVADVPTAGAATVIVMRIDLRTVSLVQRQDVKMLLHIPEAIEATESEHPPGTVIEIERVNGILVGKGMAKGIVTEKERKIGTGRETERGTKTRTKTKNVIVATGTETGTETETVIVIVTAVMRRIVTETRGKSGNLLVVVPPPRQHLLPPIRVI